jgi:hypothetical protein
MSSERLRAAFGILPQRLAPRCSCRGLNVCANISLIRDEGMPARHSPQRHPASASNRSAAAQSCTGHATASLDSQMIIGTT